MKFQFIFCFKASTPSGDNNDKNSISMLSGSTESLETINSREKYLQTAFESLSGVEQLNTGMNDEISKRINPSLLFVFFVGNNKNTLSALHHNTRSSVISSRNIPLVNETKQAKYENDAIKKREELNRRIEQTRMQLQSVSISRFNEFFIEV